MEKIRTHCTKSRKQDFPTNDEFCPWNPDGTGRFGNDAKRRGGNIAQRRGENDAKRREENDAKRREENIAQRCEGSDATVRNGATARLPSPSGGFWNEHPMKRPMTPTPLCGTDSGRRSPGGCRGMPHPPAQPPGTQGVDPQRSLRMSYPLPPSPRMPCPHGGIVPG